MMKQRFPAAASGHGGYLYQKDNIPSGITKAREEASEAKEVNTFGLVLRSF